MRTRADDVPRNQSTLRRVVIDRSQVVTEPTFGSVLGQSIAQSMGEAYKRTDLAKLVLPSPLLRVLLFEIGSQLVSAKAAGDRALGISDRLLGYRHAPMSADDFWQQVLACITFAANGSQFVWPLDSSRDRQKADRASDLQMLLGRDGDRGDAFQTVKLVRDASAHLDDRIMERYRLHGPSGMASRQWGAIDPEAELLPFYCWDPEQRLLGCSDIRIQLDSLLSEIDQLQKRSSEAVLLMMHVDDED